MNIPKDYIKEIVGQFVSGQGGAIAVANRYGVSGADNTLCVWLIESLCRAIVKEINKRTSHKITLESIKHEWVNPTTAHIYIDEASDVWRRDSLYDGGEKIENVLKLWIRGRKHTETRAYGEWYRGNGDVIKTSGVTFRGPDSFLKAIVDSFNERYAGKVVAILDDEYM